MTNSQRWPIRTFAQCITPVKILGIIFYYDQEIETYLLVQVFSLFTAITQKIYGISLLANNSNLLVTNERWKLILRISIHGPRLPPKYYFNY